MKKLFIVLAALLLLCSCGSRPADHGEDFAPCTICGRITGIDELTDIGYNDEYLCKDCLENRTFLCDYCGSRYPLEAMISKNPTYCEFCRDDVPQCYTCNAYSGLHHFGDILGTGEDTYFCGECIFDAISHSGLADINTLINEWVDYTMDNF